MSIRAYPFSISYNGHCKSFYDAHHKGAYNRHCKLLIIAIVLTYSSVYKPSLDNCLSRFATPRAMIAVTVAVCSWYSGMFFVYKSRSVCQISPVIKIISFEILCGET